MKRTSRKKSTSYTIPFKSPISTEEDAKTKIDEKKELFNDTLNNKKTKAMIMNCKANKQQKKNKQSRKQKKKEQDKDNFKYEIEGNKIIYEKQDRNSCNISNSVINSNGPNSDETDNVCYKIIVDINLLMNEIIKKVCEKESKLTTFQQLEVGKDFPKQKNVMYTDEDLVSIIKNNSSYSFNKDSKNETRNIKDLQDNPSDKAKHNKNELSELIDVEGPQKVNYKENNDSFKCYAESMSFKIKENKENIKRKKELDKVNDSDSIGTKCKKKKIDNNNSHTACINRKKENFENFCKSRTESIHSPELRASAPYVSKNSTLKENQTFDTHSSNYESNKSLSLNSLKKDDNILLQAITNQTGHFEENFTDLKSDTTTLPGSWSAQESMKKILTIPCMSALDYFNTFIPTEQEGPRKTDDISKLGSLSKELNHDIISVHNEKNSISQKELNKKEFTHCENNTENINENETSNQSSHKVVSFHGEINKNEGTNLNISSITQAETETSPNFDKQIDRDIKINIFSKEEFIAEKIIFREKESDENDVIPTGVFKHLNEIFEYNDEKSVIDLKNATSTKLDEFIFEKCKTFEDSYEEMKLEEALLSNNIKDSAITINENTLKQDCLTFPEVNLNKNGENIDRDINLTNLLNTLQEDNKSTNVCNNQESAKLSNIEDEFIIKVEIGDTVEVIESSGNKARKNNEECFTQSTTSEEKYFSDLENCMEMDDDFDLTASQLNMLDEDEKMQSTHKINAEQQTEISGPIYMQNDSLTKDVVKELQSLRESIECLKEKLDTFNRSKEFKS